LKEKKIIYLQKEDEAGDSSGKLAPVETSFQPIIATTSKFQSTALIQSYHSFLLFINLLQLGWLYGLDKLATVKATASEMKIITRVEPGQPASQCLELCSIVN